MANIIAKTKVKAGRQVLVENIDKHPLANKYYICIWIEDSDGKNEEALLFTVDELEVARDRAKRNPEDIPKKDWLTDLLD